MMAETLNLIKKISGDFLKAVGDEGTVNIIESKNGGDILVDLNLSDPQFLIGPKGMYLEAFERLLRVMVRRQSSEEIFLSIDINNYRKRRIEFLKTLAQEIGNQVALSKKPVSLEPMSAFERRIVHSEIAGRDGLISESVGEDPERWVIIKSRVED